MWVFTRKSPGKSISRTARNDVSICRRDGKSIIVFKNRRLLHPKDLFDPSVILLRIKKSKTRRSGVCGSRRKYQRSYGSH
jgi:hypothetical protein